MHEPKSISDLKFFCQYLVISIALRVHVVQKHGSSDSNIYLMKITLNLGLIKSLILKDISN